MNMPIQKKENNSQSCLEYCSQYGMTLLELMVVVIIIGVLATLIFPSFEQQILAARRGEAITYLLRLKIQQEAFRMENISYAPTEQLSMPISEYYTYIVTDESATTYTITATAKGSQLADETCLTMQIDQSMNKTPVHCFL
jgi:type IV pilus assembly protein PilE